MVLNKFLVPEGAGLFGTAAGISCGPDSQSSPPPKLLDSCEACLISVTAITVFVGLSGFEFAARFGLRLRLGGSRPRGVIPPEPARRSLSDALLALRCLRGFAPRLCGGALKKASSSFTICDVEGPSRSSSLTVSVFFDVCMAACSSGVMSLNAIRSSTAVLSTS